MQSLPVVARTTRLPGASNGFMTFARSAHRRKPNDKPWRIAALNVREPLKLDCARAGLCLVGADRCMLRGA